MKIAMYNDLIYMLKVENGEVYGCNISALTAEKFGNNIGGVLERWEEFGEFIKQANISYSEKVDVGKLQAPIRQSRQIFAVGLNYKSHVEEIKMGIGKPDIFTKFQSSIGDPYCKVKLPGDKVDWEVELVAVIGKGGRNIEAKNALSHVAGFMVGQDLSEREVQFAGSAKQFSLGKSFSNFAPIGPWITTLDEIENPLDLEITSILNGEIMQSSRTSFMINNVDKLIETLSSVCELYPGDLIFTGTPGGVGFGREPNVFIKPDDVLESRIEGLGAIRQSFV